MTKSRIGSFSVCFLTLVACCVFRTLSAQEAQLPDAPPDLVQRALYAGLRGDNTARLALLEQARAPHPDGAPARWHMGEVRVDGHWMSYDKATAQFSADPNLAEYGARRNRKSATPREELALARWCQGKDLSDWAMAHLVRVMNAEDSRPNERAMAAKQLGWTIHHGVPVLAKELPRIKKEEKKLQDDAVAWSKCIAKLTQQFTTNTGTLRQAAEEELKAITDVTAIPALQAVLSPTSEQTSLLAIDVLAGIPHHAATQSLVRHAILSPYENGGIAIEPWSSLWHGHRIGPCHQLSSCVQRNLSLSNGPNFSSDGGWTMAAQQSAAGPRPAGKNGNGSTRKRADKLEQVEGGMRMINS